MKRLLAVLSVAAFLGAPASLFAEEVPHLEFVRELRARYPDLALQYLDILRQSKLAPEVAAVLPLETAKIHLELANAEADANSRLALYDKARKEFQEFIDKNPANVFVADARVELARVTSLQGKTQLNRALLDADGTARAKGAVQARETFNQTNVQLQAAADQLTRDLDKFPEPKTPQQKEVKQALEQARLQAQMDIGLNLLDQAQTFLENDQLLQRGKVIEQAITVLQKVANGDTKNPLTYQARAWVGYCQFQTDDLVNAAAKLKEVASLTEPVAAAGRRLAICFQMKLLFRKGDVAQVGKDGEAWLKEYRAFAGTPEGCGVRYYLADALYQQAQEPKVEKTARVALLAKARDLCHDLMNSENEYRDQARILSVRVIGLEGGFEKAIDKLTNFDECVTRAEYEAVKAKEFAEKKDAKPEDIGKERKLRTENAIAALERALDLAAKPGAKVTPADLSKARLNLCYDYFSSNRPKDAIRVGEQAARAVPPTGQSALAAMYVLEAYNNYINYSTNAKDPKEAASLAELEQDGTLGRMKSLADMMIERWPNEQAGDVAHHMRGLLLLKQNKTVEAIDDLSKVSAKYPSQIYVKYQLAIAATQAADDRRAQAKNEPDLAKKEQFTKEQAQFEKVVLDTLKAFPDLPANSDSLSTSIWLNAKIDLARNYFHRREYGEIAKVVDPILKGLDNKVYNLKDLPPPDPKDPDKTAADQTRTSLVMLKLYANWGLADSELAAGHPAKVKEITDPIMNSILEGKYTELKTDPKLRWGLMGLSLRVNIQEGNTDRALKILQAAQKIAEADEGDAAAKEGAEKGILMVVAKMVKDQLREVRKKKDEKAINEAITKYTGFIGALEKGAKPKGSEEEFNRILAEAYAALGDHEAAIRMARLVREPKQADFKDDNVFKAKSNNYHYCRFLIVRELRLQGKDDKLKEAAAELDEVRKTAWGKDHPETTKETLHLLGVNSPGKAATDWNKLVAQLAQKMQQGSAPETKEQFFECYYNWLDCMTRYAKNLKDEKKKEDMLKRVANNIVRLEKSYPDFGGDDSKARFTDLLERESELKEQYDKLKGDK